MKLAELVADLDGYFGIPDVRDDDWSKAFEQVYAEPYWREYVAAGWEGRWNGLMTRNFPASPCTFNRERNSFGESMSHSRCAVRPSAKDRVALAGTLAKI